MVSILAVHRLVMQAGALVLVVAPAERQSGEFLRRNGPAHQRLQRYLFSKSPCHLGWGVCGGAIHRLRGSTHAWRPVLAEMLGSVFEGILCGRAPLSGARLTRTLRVVMELTKNNHAERFWALTQV